MLTTLISYLKIISGDCIVIRNAQQKDGKYLEKQVMLSHISAPRLGRRVGGQNDAVIEADQVSFTNFPSPPSNTSSI